LDLVEHAATHHSYEESEHSYTKPRSRPSNGYRKDKQLQASRNSRSKAFLTTKIEVSFKGG